MAERVRFRATIEPWKPGATGGLMIVVLPDDAARALGGLRQMRVTGTVNGAEIVSNTMPRGGGKLAMSVSRALMKSARAGVGDDVDVELERAEG